MNRFFALLWLALLALAAPAAAQTFPPLTGRVVDQADLLRPEQELDLTSKLAALEAQTKRQFVVVTLKSLEGRTIEDYGYRLGRTWKIGDEKKDDGVLLVVAPNEKKVRIETGYGARVFLTDAMSSVIVNNAILPRFRQGDFAGGITAGAAEVIRQMSLSPVEAQKRASEVQKQEAGRSRGGSGFFPVLFWMIIILFVIIPMIRRAAGGGKRYRPRRGGFTPPIILWGPGLGGGGGSSSWGGGGGGGGFGGFGGFSGGGGSFGGGGASGGW